jgi:hypothetical protein
MLYQSTRILWAPPVLGDFLLDLLSDSENELDSDKEPDVNHSVRSVDATRTFADSFVKITKPRTSTNPKTMKATKRRAEKKLLLAAKLGGDNSDEVLHQCLQTKVCIIIVAHALTVMLTHRSVNWPFHFWQKHKPKIQ